MEFFIAISIFISVFALVFSLRKNAPKVENRVIVNDKQLRDLYHTDTVKAIVDLLQKDLNKYYRRQFDDTTVITKIANIARDIINEDRHKTEESVFNRAEYAVNNRINSEQFIDEIVKRIKTKQL